MADYDEQTSRKAAVEQAGKAVEELRRSIGLPTDRAAQTIGARIQEIARAENVLVEWDVRVLRRGETVEAACNCHCYA